MPVRVADRVEHCEENPHALANAETRLVAVLLDGTAMDMLQDQVRLAVRRDACVDQVRNVRMLQSGKDATFTDEALLGRSADQPGIQKLDRGFAFVPSVAPVSQPHR